MSISILGKVVEEIKSNEKENLRNCFMDNIHKKLEDSNFIICDHDIAGTQTLAANSAHKSSQIHQIDSSIISILTEKDACMQKESRLHVIEGIDKIVRDSYGKGQLFSELGVPWAIKGKIFPFQGYERFPSIANAAL